MSSSSSSLSRIIELIPILTSFLFLLVFRFFFVSGFYLAWTIDFRERNNDKDKKNQRAFFGWLSFCLKKKRRKFAYNKKSSPSQSVSQSVTFSLFYAHIVVMLLFGLLYLLFFHHWFGSAYFYSLQRKHTHKKIIRVQDNKKGNIFNNKNQEVKFIEIFALALFFFCFLNKQHTYKYKRYC